MHTKDQGKSKNNTEAIQDEFYPVSNVFREDKLKVEWYGIIPLPPPPTPPPPPLQPLHSKTPPSSLIVTLQMPPG